MRLQLLGSLRVPVCLAMVLAASVVSAPAQQPPLLPVDFELRGGGLNYDDVCFWEDPNDPESSLAFITSKIGPVVEVFRLTTGQMLGSIPGFDKPNNCDVSGNLLVTTDAIGKKVLVHSIPDFELVATFASGFSQPEGVAVLREDGRPFAAITDRTQGRVHIYDLASSQFVRSFATGFTANEGTATDELYQHIIVTDGDSGQARVFTITGTQLAEFGRAAIDNDAEGVAIYRCGTTGWIVISDQLENSSQPTQFEIFDRVSFAHVGTFRMQNAVGDATNATDGLDIFQVPTSRSATGFLAACDDCNDAGDDFDVIRWDRIADAFGLARCPRGIPPTCGNGVVEAAWEECDGTADGLCPDQCGADCTCAAPPFCGNAVAEPPTEECDRFDDTACPGACRPNCTCPGPPVCGDGMVNQASEACDRTDDAACPQVCRVDCTCGTPPSGSVEADVTVDSDAPNTPRGGSVELSLDADPAKRTFLRVRVSNLGNREIAAVLLHLQASGASSAGSDSGGRIQAISGCAWNESTVTWNTQPPLDGTMLATAGAVSATGTTVMNITPAIAGDGVYCFAMDTLSSNGVTYRSREATSGRPRVEIALAPLVCGDGAVNQAGEECDGADAAACPGACEADCSCPTSTTTTTTTTTTSTTALPPPTTTTLPEMTTTTIATTTTTEPPTPTTTQPPTTTTTVAATTTTAPVTTTTTTTLPAPACGDGVINQPSEQCDGTDAAACPGACEIDCRCPAPTTTTTTTTAPPTTTTTLPPPPPVGTVVADARTEADSATKNFGADVLLSADADSTKHTFLRLQASGVGTRTITSARLRLTADSATRAASDSGGRIRAIGDCTWSEPGITFNNAPAIAGTIIETLGPVARNQVVEFDLTTAIPGDGTYCFAIDSASENGVDYRSREATTGRPELILEVSAAATTTTTTAPPSTTTTTVPPPTTSTTGPITTTTTLPPTTTTTAPPTTTTTLPVTTTTTLPQTTTTTTTTATTSTTTTTLAAPATEILADTRTEVESPSTNFGSSTVLSVDADSAKHTFLRVRVTGIGPRAVTRAVIQLRVPDVKRADSVSGGRIHRAADCAWSETGVTFNDEPAIDPTVLSTVGPVARGALAEFDVTAAVPADGTYCFAIASLSDDGADYGSREASTGRPVFVVTVAP